MERYDYYPAVVAGIECFLFGVEQHAGAPVVFVMHGRGGAAAHAFPWCRELAANGMIAVAFDQRNHGRRLIDPEANGGWSLHHAANMYGNILGTAQDVSMLIDMLPARYGLSMQRIGVTGGSMGGHSSLLAMAIDARIAVGAPMIGGGDYRHLMELRAQENNTAPEDFPRYFPEALDAVVQKFDPIHHPERFADRPLLMSNGEDDTLVQISANRRLESALRPHYIRMERLALHAYPGVGHSIPDEMWQQTLGWLTRWLPV